MGLKNGTVCIKCGQHTTQHPSQICSLCRASQNEQVLCTVCHEIYTTHASHVCYSCRKSKQNRVAKSGEDLAIDVAITRAKEDISILKSRLHKKSIKTISKSMHQPQAEIYARLQTMLGKPTGAGGFDIIDGSYIEVPEEIQKAQQKYRR